MNARRWTLALLGVALCACGREAPAPPANAEHEPAPPQLAPLDVAFVDETARSGLRFEHATGATGEKLLPETMGSGCALFDFDGDGVLDVFLVNSGVWRAIEPGADHVAREGEPRCALFRGRGDGTFEDVSASTHADVAVYGMGVSAADFDGDGDDDLLITALGDCVLLRNDAGRFVDVSAGSGLAAARWRDRDGVEHPEWSTASAWFDADSDGDLDLVVGNYVQWTRAAEIFTTLDGVTKAFTTPDRYRGLPCRLYLNDGHGVFEDASERAGFARVDGKCLGLALWDFDDDGRLDVVVANDTQPNFLFINRSKPGAPAFEERGLTAGLAYDESGRARAGMGLDAGCIASDGAPWVAIGNFAGESLSLYRQRSDGAFENRARAAGLANPTLASLTFGLAFVDADLDGALDLALANGHIEPDIARFSSGAHFAQAPLLFRGRGDGSFDDVSALAGADFSHEHVARGLAYGDVDRDGDLDLLLTTNGGAPVLLINRAQQLRPRHFLHVELHGKGLNPHAIGARIRLRAAGTTRTRFVRTGSSYLSQSELAPTFGLGSATAVDELLVRWPSGRESAHSVTAVDRTVVLEEP